MKRWLCAALTLALIMGCAHAEFAPLLDALEQEAESGRVLACTVTAEVKELPSVSEPALLAIQNQVSKLSLRMAFEQGDEHTSLASFAYDGVDVLKVGSKATPQGVQALLGGNIYETPSGEADALTVLMGDAQQPFPRLKKGRETLWGQLENMYTILGRIGQEGELVKATTSILNVGSSSRYIPYQLNEEQMNEAWQELCPLFADVMDAMYPEGCAAQKTQLAALRFIGDAQVRRVRDKEENDWGFQMTACVEDMEGAARKVTCTVAWRVDKGFCVEIKAPKVEGDDSVKMLLSGGYTLSARENILKLEGSYTNRANGQTDKRTLKGTVRCTPEEVGDRLHGKITCEQNDETCVYELNLLCTMDALQGDVSIRQRQKSGTYAYVFHVDAALQDEILFSGEYTVSLADMEPWEKAFILRDMEKNWTQALIRVLAQMPSDERALITHVLRSDMWLQKEESAPVPENGNFRRVEEELVE